MEFLGVHFDLSKESHVNITQPKLMDDIIKELKLDKDKVKIKDIPMESIKLLLRHPKSPKFDNSFHYRRVIGMLNYVERCSRPDISYVVHQCARFCEDPKIQHGMAVKWLGRYLKFTLGKGIHVKITDEDIIVLVDAYFSGNWYYEISQIDRDTDKSRHGYIIKYKGLPVSWASQIQTVIALSYTESKYMSLSTALRKVIPLMEFLRELQSKGIIETLESPKFPCKVYKDN